MKSEVHLGNAERRPLCGSRPTDWYVAQNVGTCTCLYCLTAYREQEEGARDRARTSEGRMRRQRNVERAMYRFNALRGEEDQ
jgi:hypothetical protein